MADAPFGPGTLLAGRFRLEDLLDETGGARLWRATDQTLARSVAVHLLPGTDPRATSLLRAARSSALVSDGHLLRVLDAASADGVVYVVNEWGSGVSLDRLLAEGPLSARRAAWVVKEVAEAVATAHRNGVAHGRLLPENVMISEVGSVKVLGLVVDAVLRTDPGGPRLVTGGDPLGDRESDVLNLAALLYAALVGRWPGTEGSSIPTAPSEHGRPLRPRRVRAGVPRPLDAICERVLNASPAHLVPIETAHEVYAALSDYIGDPGAAPVSDPAAGPAGIEPTLRLDRGALPPASGVPAAPGTGDEAPSADEVDTGDLSLTAAFPPPPPPGDDSRTDDHDSATDDSATDDSGSGPSGPGGPEETGPVPADPEATQAGLPTFPVSAASPSRSRPGPAPAPGPSEAVPSAPGPDRRSPTPPPPLPDRPERPLFAEGPSAAIAAGLGDPHPGAAGRPAHPAAAQDPSAPQAPGALERRGDPAETDGSGSFIGSFRGLSGAGTAGRTGRTGRADRRPRSRPDTLPRSEPGLRGGAAPAGGSTSWQTGTGTVPATWGPDADEPPPADPDDEEAAGPPVPGRSWLRLAVLLAVALVVVVAAVLALDRTGGSSDTPAGADPSRAPSSSSPASVRVPITGVDDFDPEGDPPEENPDLADLAVDGRPGTAWRTVTYYGNPRAGGLKSGVGLLVDLGRPSRVGSVRVTLLGRGTSLDLLAAPGARAAPTSTRGLATVASATDAGTEVSLTAKRPVTSRWLVVWLTSLPRVSGGYQGQVAEISVRS